MESESDIKDFFKQKKKTGGSSKAKSSSSAVTPKHSASYDSETAQPAALVSHGSVDLQDIKDFFKQEKKTGGSSKAKSSSSAVTPKHSTSYDSETAQPAALVSHGSVDLQDEYDENEKKLRQFDLNMAYGPCIGISRLDRWERAKKLGLNPPEDIERLLKSGQVKDANLWDGLV